MREQHKRELLKPVKMKIKSCWATYTRRRGYTEERSEMRAESWCAPFLMLQSRE